MLWPYQIHDWHRAFRHGTCTLGVKALSRRTILTMSTTHSHGVAAHTNCLQPSHLLAWEMVSVAHRETAVDLGYKP